MPRTSAEVWSRWQGPVPGSAEELFARVAESLGSDAGALLDAFVELDMAELPEAMARSLPLPNAGGALQELMACGVLHRPRPGYWRLPALLREFALTARGAARAGHSRAELEAALAATANPSPLEPYVLLAVRTPRSSSPAVRDSVSVVAAALAQRNDLARLLLLSRGVGREHDLNLPLAAVLRQIGDVAEAARLIASARDREAARVESAELGREKGQLSSSDWTLFLRSLESTDGRQLRLLAALLLDQGQTVGAATER